MGKGLKWCAVTLAVALAVVPTVQARTVSSHSEESFSAIPGGTVSVDVSFHDVTVTVVPGSDVKIVVDLQISGSASKAEDLLEDYMPKFSERGDTIAVRSTRKGGGFMSGFFGSVQKQGRVEITMPPGMNLNVDVASGDCEVAGDMGDAKILVDTASGDVRVNGAAESIVVDVASGDVELELTRVAQLVNVDSASGEVRLRGGAAEFRADTASGDVSAFGLTGSMLADTASGDVKAQWDVIDPGARIVADTASGDVRLVLPAGTPVKGGLSTTSGDIETDYPGHSFDKGRSFKFSSESGVRVDVDTASGDIEVLSR